MFHEMSFHWYDAGREDWIRGMGSVPFAQFGIQFASEASCSLSCCATAVASIRDRL